MYNYPENFEINTMNSRMLKCNKCLISLCKNHESNICHICQDRENGFKFQMSLEPIPSLYCFAQKYNRCDDILYFKANEEVCSTCDRCLKELANKSIKDQNEPKRVECKICHGTYKNKHSLRQHLKIHSNNKPFQCKLCDKKFIRKDALINHSRVHSNDKPYQCKICHKRYRSKASLRVHSRIHDENNPFKCKHCNKYLTSKTALKRHLKVHSNERPFQ